MTRRPRVGVLFGGRSGEHEVSLVSARSILAALDPARYEVIPIGITREGRWIFDGNPLAALEAAAEARQTLLRPGQATAPARLGAGDPTPAPAEAALVAAPAATAVDLIPRGIPPLDVVFPVLHGPFGEDGTVQGLLELAGIPYVGSGVAASAVGMDKALMKAVFRDAGLPTVPMCVIRRSDLEADEAGTIERIEQTLGYPCFTKPANLGSSVGISQARDRAGLQAGLREAARHDRKIVVEKGLRVREIECSVLGNDEPIASVPGEIIPAGEFYDYRAKYQSDDSQLVIPAEIPAETSDEIRRLAIAAFRAIDGSGLARVDFFLEIPSGRVYVNEINTMPGFTAISMYPKLWEASGLPYPELVARLIELALERR